MLIESYLLEQFESVSRCGTLLKASEELHISQPSLSRSMKKLEDVLGVSLFIRENSKISLNETGKLAADYARRALEANQEMIERVTAFDRSLRAVSIGSCSPFPINDLMPTLQEQLPGKTLSTELVSTMKSCLPVFEAIFTRWSFCITVQKIRACFAIDIWMNSYISPLQRTILWQSRTVSLLKN